MLSLVCTVVNVLSAAAAADPEKPLSTEATINEFISTAPLVCPLSLLSFRSETDFIYDARLVLLLVLLAAGLKKPKFY